ncbi:hypothetical protein TNCV_1720941 [Trichonephila clavipes]|nr:hypothetical protein TNCV_1720941 [Trichonephila clavipes]
MSFGFFGPELMATLFQPNPRSEVRKMQMNKLLNIGTYSKRDGSVRFGWKRVSINSGSKEPKGHVNEKTREPVTTLSPKSEEAEGSGSLCV